MKTTLLAIFASFVALSTGCKKTDAPGAAKPAPAGKETPAAAPSSQPAAPPSQPAPPPAAPAPAAPAKQGALPGGDRTKMVGGKKVELFGADVSAAAPVTLASVLESPGGFDGKAAVVTGKVRFA